MRISNIFLILLVFLATPSISEDLDWPVKRKIDLASGFGDLRANRFHAGIDIRTGGVTGEPVYSPVNGYVWRIKMSYEGYGKALYIRGDDDHIYVFAHLAKFIPEIDTLVKKAQIHARRYYLDMNLPVNKIRVKKGQLLAQSGQTGVGAPHLHFERRSPDNQPLNPLSHGFALTDKVRPIFRRLGFQIADDTSMFQSGQRKKFFDVSPTGRPGEYSLDTLLYFNRPFGVLADCFDLMRPDGKKRSVRMLELYVDDVLFYKTLFDTLDYSTEQSVNFEYDYIEAVDDRTKVRRLFAENGNEFLGSRALHGSRGVVGEPGADRLGLRQARIVAEDCCGNRSVLNFRFLWGPAESIFKLDSTVTTPSDSIKFYFTAVKEHKQLGIDSVLTVMNQGEQWRTRQTVKTSYSDNGSVVCAGSVNNIRGRVLRLVAFAGKSALIHDTTYSGIREKVPKRASNWDISVDEEGLWVTIRTLNKIATAGWVKLYNNDTLLGTKRARMLNMKTYRCFIPPEPRFATVNKVGLVLHSTPDGPEIIVDSLSFYAVGFGDREIESDDGLLHLRFDDKTLYKPLFIQLKRRPIYNRATLWLNSDLYEVFPKAFRCREEFDMEIKLRGNLPVYGISGMCWLDVEENRWVWLDNIVKDNSFTAGSLGGGSFAIVTDYENPGISELNVEPNRVYSDASMPIRFMLKDTLSGFEDDRSIQIKLDGQWVIPEYDAENFWCTTQPLKPLKGGGHHLAIIVTDRAGNKTEKYLQFRIGKRRGGRR